MTEELIITIKSAKLILHKGVFIYAKVNTFPRTGNHFVIVKDADEITVITEKENTGDLEIIEQSQSDRALLEIIFAPDSPDAPGFLAAVSSVLAEAGISISVVSSYSKDYILVASDQSDIAIKVLTGLGFSLN